MSKHVLRFIAPPSHALRLSQALEGAPAPLSVRTLELECSSMRAIRTLCAAHGVQFEIIGMDVFLRDPRLEGISLLLDADLEPLLYSPCWDPPLPVDGLQASRIVADKFRTYRMLRNTHHVRQPVTALVRNHRELHAAIESIPSRVVVVKPRCDSDSAENVLILDRERLRPGIDPERLNFTNVIVQEYPARLLLPPVEWRLHYVGRSLCRCIRTVDKHGWYRAFATADVAADSIPDALLLQATEAIACLVPPASKDNVALDFLEADDGFVFLEANCGALGSFYVDDPSNTAALAGIFETLFRRYFRRARHPSAVIS